MGDFKVGMLGKCLKCGKTIKLLTIQHRFCKVCRKEHDVVRQREYAAQYEGTRKTEKRCWICGDRVMTYSVKKPTCDFCQTYTISWNEASKRKKYTPERIREIKRELLEMVEESSFKRFGNSSYTSVLGGERL